MKPIRVVFLDYGNTLGFGDESPADVWSTFLHQLVGVRVPIMQIQRALEDADRFRAQSVTYHPATDEFWIDYDRFVLRELGVELEDDTQFAVSINKAFQVHRWTSNLFPETREALEGLRRLGCRLGVISNNTEQLPRELDEHQLASFFESVTYSAELGVEKPDPQIFNLAIQRMGCAPHEAVHVGDSYEKDVVGARAVGVTPILIDREGNYPDVDCLRIADLRELLGVL